MVGNPYEGPIDVGGYMLMPKGLEKWRRNMSSLRSEHMYRSRVHVEGEARSHDSVYQLCTALYLHQGKYPDWRRASGGLSGRQLLRMRSLPATRSPRSAPAQSDRQDGLLFQACKEMISEHPPSTHSPLHQHAAPPAATCYLVHLNGLQLYVHTYCAVQVCE